MCDRPCHARGLCSAHYTRLRLRGDLDLRPPRAATADDLTHLIRCGTSVTEALARLGWSRQAAMRWAYRAGRADLIAALKGPP